MIFSVPDFHHLILQIRLRHLQNLPHCCLTVLSYPFLARRPAVAAAAVTVTITPQALGLGAQNAICSLLNPIPGQNQDNPHLLALLDFHLRVADPKQALHL